MVKAIYWGSVLCFIMSLSLIGYSFSSITDTDQVKKAYHKEVNEGADTFLRLLIAESNSSFEGALNYIGKNWVPEYEIMLLETLYYTRSTDRTRKLIQLMQQKTGKKFGSDIDKWYHWIWNKESAYSDEYFSFKARIHEFIDPKFKKYFQDRAGLSNIRLDEVRWGGVLQDGIPPLRGPKMTNALEATYLRDGATVFGIEINGDARAYPKQVLAWHEMFVDKVGGVDVAGVYCTLCGTVILYQTEHEGIVHEMGTSGFLYRSNKLMYDKATQSLWSTLEGEPVIGPLVNKGIRLEYLSVVTTTWGEWKRRHPDTKVLSLDTGHKRDYREGVAYKDYFATDELMFTVPNVDKSLKNKDEVLAVRLPGKSTENLAIDSKFLKKNPIYQNQIGGETFTVFTDNSGAHRAYKTGSLVFESYDGDSEVTDSKGIVWQLHENSMDALSNKLERLPTHNAFWFGYKAAFPEVTLIK